MVDPEHQSGSGTLDERVRRARERLNAVVVQRPDVGRIRRRARRPIVAAAAASFVLAAGVFVAWAGDDNKVATVAGPDPAGQETVAGAVQFSDVERAARLTMECIDAAGYNATEPEYDPDLRSFTFGVENPDNEAAGVVRRCINEHYQPIGDLWLGATNQPAHEREQAVEQAVVRCLAAAGFDVDELTAEAVDRVEAEASGARERCLVEALGDGGGDTPPATPAEVPQVTAFGFVGEDGIVRIVHPAQGGAAEPQPVDAVRGEEGSTSLAVAPGGEVVYHDTFFSGCLTNLVRTEVGGDSQVLVENAANPGLDRAGERLAYSSGTECTPDGDVLAVRDFASGDTESVRIGDDDGLPYRIHDVEWVGDRVAVLASQYDGTPVAQMVLLYSVPESGPPVFDSQLPLGDQGRGTLDDFAYPNIEPVPGDPDSVLRTRSSADGGTDLTVLDLGTGDERTLFSIDEQMTAFAARTLDDVLYVATEPKVPGEQAQGDTLRRRVGGQDLPVAEDVTSVALVAP